MTNAKICLTRIIEGDRQTLGAGALFEDNIFKMGFVTLELPNLHNKTSISSIPADTYKAIVTTDSRGRVVVLLLDVPGRSGIEIHIGNYYTDIAGCILIGRYFADINADGLTDVKESTPAMEELLGYLPDEGQEFTVEITKAYT